MSGLEITLYLTKPCGENDYVKKHTHLEVEPMILKHIMAPVAVIIMVSPCDAPLRISFESFHSCLWHGIFLSVFLSSACCMVYEVTPRMLLAQYSRSHTHTHTHIYILSHTHTHTYIFSLSHTHTHTYIFRHTHKADNKNSACHCQFPTSVRVLPSRKNG